MSYKISSFPGQSGNPYLDLFYGALAPSGVETAESFKFSLKWLFDKRGEIDVIHFHWPEWLWDGRREGSARALLKLQAILRVASALGIKLIWTVHNLDIHEGSGWQDKWGQRLLARHCDMLITHSQTTAERVHDRLRPRKPVVVMPHGSYEGHYPEPRDRETVLAELGLEDDRPLLCCVGRLRDYKGLDLACEALTQLGDEVRLVIAGVPHRGFDMAPLEHYAETLPGLTLIARPLSDQEFVDILSVSDATLLPYRQITGSGTLLAAWTQGCGVVASDLDYFREMLPDGSNAGKLFQPGNTDAIAYAVQEYLSIPLEKRREAARAMATQFSWNRCVEPVSQVLQGWQREDEA